VDRHPAEEEEAAVSVSERWQEREVEPTNKNGIQAIVSTMEAKNERMPRRYSSSANASDPAPGKTTRHASQISNECM
jgi:hypothetical protein